MEKRSLATAVDETDKIIYKTATANNYGHKKRFAWRFFRFVLLVIKVLSYAVTEFISTHFLNSTLNMFNSKNQTGKHVQTIQIFFFDFSTEKFYNMMTTKCLEKKIKYLIVKNKFIMHFFSLHTLYLHWPQPTSTAAEPYAVRYSN